MAMAFPALRDHRTVQRIECVECGQQGSRATVQEVVGGGPGDRLDRALLVTAEHHRMDKRAHVQSHDIDPFHLCDAGQLREH